MLNQKVEANHESTSKMNALDYRVAVGFQKKVRLRTGSSLNIKNQCPSKFNVFPQYVLIKVRVNLIKSDPSRFSMFLDSDSKFDSVFLLDERIRVKFLPDSQPCKTL